MFEQQPDRMQVLLEQCRQAEAQAGRAFVAQCDAAQAVWDASPADTRTGRDPQAEAELAVVLGLSPLSVGCRLRQASALQNHPLLRDLLLTGRLRVPHAIACMEELLDLGDPGLGDRVVRAVLMVDGRLGWEGTPGALRTAVQRAAVRLDPEGAARRRQERQVAAARVRLRARSDGIADLTATGAAEQLGVAHRLLDLLATSDDPDDARTHGQRQVDALLAALVARAGSGLPLELQLEIPVRTAVAGICTETVLPEPIAVRADLDADLLAVLAAAATHGGDGPLPHDVGWADAEAAAAGSSQPGGRRTRRRRSPVACAPATTPRAGGAGRPAAAAAAPAEVSREAEESPDGLSTRAATVVGAAAPAPSRPGPAVGPLTAAPPGRRRPRGGVPELVGHGPLDPARLSGLLTDPRGLPVGLSQVRLRRLLVDRTGQVIAADARAVPLGRVMESGPARAGRDAAPGADHTDANTTRVAPPGDARAERVDPTTVEAGRLLRRLLTALPVPPPRAPGYRPTAAQTRVLDARERTCVFPGCTRTAARSDLDHQVRYPDGPTSTANLHALCRHHHRLKHDGWTCRRAPDGTTTWTSPGGQVRRVPAR